MNAPHTPATVAEQLHVGSGFTADERPGIVEQLNSLDARLATHPAAETDLELSVEDQVSPYGPSAGPEASSEEPTGRDAEGD